MLFLIGVITIILYGWNMPFIATEISENSASSIWQDDGKSSSDDLSEPYDSSIRESGIGDVSPVNSIALSRSVENMEPVEELDILKRNTSTTTISPRNGSKPKGVGIEDPAPLIEELEQEKVRFEQISKKLQDLFKKLNLTNANKLAVWDPRAKVVMPVLNEFMEQYNAVLHTAQLLNRTTIRAQQLAKESQKVYTVPPTTMKDVTFDWMTPEH